MVSPISAPRPRPVVNVWFGSGHNEVRVPGTISRSATDEVDATWPNASYVTDEV